MRAGVTLDVAERRPCSEVDPLPTVRPEQAKKSSQHRRIRLRLLTARCTNHVLPQIIERISQRNTLWTGVPNPATERDGSLVVDRVDDEQFTVRTQADCHVRLKTHTLPIEKVGTTLTA